MEMIPLFFCFYLPFLSGVESWTVNLAEIKTLDSDKTLEQNNKKEFVYDELNIDKNSEYNIDKSKYAKEYEYQGYKDEKATNVILNGSRYLEGLSQALFEYRQMLEDCGDTNVTSTKTEQAQVPEAKATCNNTTNNSKIVQKLSELALKTASKLENRTHDMDKDGEREENELLLQLAWYLDHLSRMTGYVPSVNDFNTTDTLQSEEDTTKVTEVTKESSLELLETVENGRFMSKIAPKVTTDKTVVKRSITPLKDVVKYYTKYNLWNGSNSNTSDSNFDIDNGLRIKSITKRSIPRKKYGYLINKNVTMSNKINLDKLGKRVIKVIVLKKLRN